MALVGISLITLLAFTALAVDIGLGASRTRDLQQVADLVALDVSRLLGGGTPPANSVIDAQVAASSARNDFPVAGSFPNYSSGTRSMQLTLGCWEDPDDDGLFVFTPGCAGPNAVRVRAEDDVDYKFADVIGFGEDRFDRTATAAIIPKAHVQIGSVAAGIQNGLNGPIGARVDAYVQALNGRLKAAFNTESSLTPPPNGAGLDLVSYQGLAASSVAVGDLATAAGFGSPSELADATITNGEFFEATALALESEGNDAAAATIRSFAASSDFDADGTMQLGGDDGFLQFEQGTGTADDPAAARARVNVVDLLTGAAAVADGRNFFSYEINPAIPGVASIDVVTRIVEPPRWDYGPVGTSVGTAQIQQQLTVNLTSDLLGIPGTSFPHSLPIVVEGATGDATLTRIQCTEPIEATETDVLAVTSLARATVGVAQNFQAEGDPALNIQAGTIIEAGPLSLQTILYFGLNPLQLLLNNDVTGSGTASLGGGTETLTFLPATDPTPSQRASGGVTASFGSTLQSNTTLVGLPLLGITNLTTSLTSVFDELGDGIIDPILQAAGITLGGADVWSDYVDCAAPTLVG
jgi:uncharacterized membrane protein